MQKVSLWALCEIVFESFFSSFLNWRYSWPINGKSSVISVPFECLLALLVFHWRAFQKGTITRWKRWVTNNKWQMQHRTKWIPQEKYKEGRECYLKSRNMTLHFEGEEFFNCLQRECRNRFVVCDLMTETLRTTSLLPHTQGRKGEASDVCSRVFRGLYSLVT